MVDTGYARISHYSHRSKVQRLPIEPISRASADQRMGRCGRVSAGVCVRLYAEQDYLSRPEFSEPEILRTNLAGVILRMKILGLGDVQAFPFIDAPSERAVKDGFRLLGELGALDENQRLTGIGRQLARLPVDPRIGRMILAAHEEGCLADVLTIASALSVQDPRERPLAALTRADERHRQFSDERSDFLGMLKLRQTFDEQARHLSKSKQRAYCQENFLSYARMQEWADTREQLWVLVTSMGFHPDVAPADYAAVHRALLAGLLGNIGFRTPGHEYLGARGTKLALHPGSALFKKGPRWIVAAELVETRRIYARMVAAIEPEWIERVAGGVCRRTYVDARWDRKRGFAVAQE